MPSVANRGALRTLGAVFIALGISACSLMTSLDGLAGGGTSEDGGSGASRGSISTPSDGSSGGGSGSGSSSGGGSGSSSSSGGVTALDAGGETGVAGGKDSGSGGSGPSDAGSPADAGADAGHATSVDAATPFCASQSPAPLFCDDFDEGSLGSWDQLATTSGAATLTTNSFVSSPDAMLVAVEPNAAVTAIDVAGYKSFTAQQGASGTATMAFDIQIVAGDESSSSDAILGAIQLWNGSTYWDLELEVFWSSSNGYYVVDLSEDGNGSGGSYVPHPVGAHIAPNQWTHVILGITLPTGSGGATTGTISLDGPSGTNNASETVHVTTSNPIPEILVGTTYATPAGAGWTVLYDNVTFDE